MKPLTTYLIYICTICAPSHDILPCGARVPEKEENHQVLNDEAIDVYPEEAPPKKDDEKIEWKDHPTIEDYEYYYKPNGVRVSRVKPRCVKNDIYYPQVLNPEFL